MVGRVVPPLGGAVRYFVGGPQFVAEGVMIVEVGGVPGIDVGHDGADGVPQ